MSIKLILDNNAPDAFEAFSDATKANVTDAIRSGRFELYATLELIEETLGLYSTARRYLLRPRVRWLLQVIQESILNHAHPIVLSELRGSPQIYLDEDLQQRTRETLEEIADEGRPLPSDLEELAHRVRHYKADQNRFFADHQSLFRALPRQQRPESPMSYDHYLEEWWFPRRPAFLTSLFASVGTADPAAKTQEALANPKRYPHVLLWLEVDAARLYRTIILDRRADPNDAHDVTQLVYLQDVDWFVTHERPTGTIHELFRLVFGGNSSKRVLTFDEVTTML